MAWDRRHSNSNKPLTTWGLTSYILLTTFVAAFLFLGLLSAHDIRDVRRKKRPQYDFPDFNRIETFSRVLTESDVSLNSTHDRIIFVGDVHGMNESLHSLLARLSFTPSHDTLFFAGDLLAKSTHASSLAVIDYLARQHARAPIHDGRQSIFPVRGNHDQLVVQWRAWREWFEAQRLPVGHALTSEEANGDSEGRALASLVRNPVRTALDVASALGVLPRHLDIPTFNTISNKRKHNDDGDDDGDDEDSIPPVHTGREFLQLLEAEWAIEKLESGPDPEEYADVSRKRARGTWREAWWRRIPPPGKGKEKQQWRLFGDHYWLARDMTREQASYLTSLPLVNHVPHMHFFVVHAGLLPSDPRRDPADKRQPLAHPPHVGGRVGGEPLVQDEYEAGEYWVGDEDEERELLSRLRAHIPLPAESSSQTTSHLSPLQSRPPSNTNTSIHTLRTLQESALLREVPQNRDPWVVLNMRSVHRKSGKVSRNGDKGTPWSEVWGEQMGRCRGFEFERERERDLEGIRNQLELALDATREDGMGEASKKKKKPSDKDKDKDYELQCYPASVVYGHAASRDLDVKRWSFGLDTGCLYGRKLSALVVSRKDESSSGRRGWVDDNKDEDAMEEGGDDGYWFKPTSKRYPFGDPHAGVEARLVQVKCPSPDDDDDDEDDE